MEPQMASLKTEIEHDSPVDDDKSDEINNEKIGATVKLYNPQSGKCLASLKSDLQKTVRDLKEILASELNVSADNVICEFKDGERSDSTQLKDIEDDKQDDLKFTLRISNKSEDEGVDKKLHKLPDTIEVKIPIEESQTSPKFRRVSVTIVRDADSRKPFMGGYSDKKSGAIYHHASVQTLPRGLSPAELAMAANRRSRDTQTHRMKSTKVQTSHDTSTQMMKPNLYVSDARDRLLTPRIYEAADVVEEKKVEKVVILQKYLRRWLARNRVNGLRMEQHKRVEWEMNELRRELEEREREMTRDRERRIHPRTKQDFDLLFASLEKWRKREEEEINSTLSGAERKAALCMLLDREAELIAIICKLQKQANDENRESGIIKFLNQASSPKTWKRCDDGKNISMMTVESTRASHLKQLYVTLKMKFEIPEERLDALLVLKNTIQEYDCKLSQELLDLIERETTLILRGVSDNHLEGLRTRIVTLYVQLVKDPVFNPQSAKCLKIPARIRTLEREYKKLLSRRQASDEEMDGTRTKEVVDLSDNYRSIDQEDASLYKYILDDVIRGELERGNKFSVAFIMQEADMKYLFENIWEGQSSLGFCTDPRQLKFARWVMDVAWSPWNCVLLSKKEAHVHDSIDKLLEFYGPEFLHKVESKHTMAQSHLSYLQLLIESQLNNSIRNKSVGKKKRDDPEVANATVKCSVYV